MSTKTYNNRDIQRILRKNGFAFDRQTGSHVIYTNEAGQHMTVRFRDCNKMVWQRMIKEYNLVV